MAIRRPDLEKCVDIPDRISDTRAEMNIHTGIIID